MKAELGEVPSVQNVAFSRRYALVNSGRTGRASQRQMFIAKATYLLASPTGAPIHIEVTQRDSGAIERPDARYTLTDADGRVVDSGSLAKGMHPLVLAVPRPGVYRFTCESRAGWEIQLSAELDSALEIEPGEMLQQSGIVKPLYFYVPKGTTQIVAYLYNPRAAAKKVSVRGPDGREVRQFQSDGKYVSIAIPPGDSGKVWSIDGEAGLRLRYFRLFGVPPAFSSNPENVFVPEELARKDGLAVVSTGAN
jgi:hypothetical protein